MEKKRRRKLAAGSMAPKLNMEEDIIYTLKNFSNLDYQTQLDLIDQGRPMPEIRDVLPKSSRSFRTEWYARKDWLCGCPARSRLFCFPCLLFSTRDSVWTQNGYCDMKNLQRSLGKHERSTSHIQSQIALKTFGTSMIDSAADEQRRLAVSIHNAKVKENREILKHLIDATCFLAKQGLPFGGNFVELVRAFAENDDNLARHLETPTAFSGTSDAIQKDLIEAVADVIRSDIKKEIEAAPFVALEVGETTDDTNEAQIFAVLRYVATSEVGCEVKEAFFGLNDRRAPAVEEDVLGVLEKYDCVQKLVAQTYEGTDGMSSNLKRLQAQLEDKAPEAMRCYARKPNLVLWHSAKGIPACRRFLKTADGLGRFFTKSAKRSSLLDDVVQRRLPGAAPTRWSSNATLLKAISKYQVDLCAALRIISENPHSWDCDTLLLATGYDQWLSKASTCFLLLVYEDIATETDALFRGLQNKTMDVEYCRERIRDTLGSVERRKPKFDTFNERFEQRCATLGLTDPETKTGHQSLRDERKLMYDQILDNASVQMRTLLDHFGELAFLELVDCSKFSDVSQMCFYESKVRSLSKYDRFFDFVRLKADLVGLCSSQTVRNECQTPEELLSFLAKQDLIQTVPEATKLLQLALTLPATTTSDERSVSTSKRLETFARNRPDQGRLGSLATIAMETARLSELKQSEDFYNRVTEMFIQRGKRPDFIYK
ncbi:synaptotagmin-12 isoform X1 [Hippocampus comes]|uniref:synaptotagmin-12 isoform X1 n=1 Tax=Hippocampus comes TaxID=109280 RepID=UPI00094F2F2E|nr:PREDICTED: synaptotagmin-12 isoform X1 [Hippocampus comes]